MLQAVVAVGTGLVAGTAMAQDVVPVPFDIGVLTAGMNLKLMAAIGLVSLICKQAKWVPEKWETLIPLGLGAVAGLGQALVAGADTGAQLANAIFEAVLVNAAVAVVAVQVVHPWISKYLPGGPSAPQG